MIEGRGASLETRDHQEMGDQRGGQSAGGWVVPRDHGIARRWVIGGGRWTVGDGQSLGTGPSNDDGRTAGEGQSEWADRTRDRPDRASEEGWDGRRRMGW